MGLIEVSHVFKEYRIKINHKNAIKNFFHKQYEDKLVIKDISFQIEQGEFVGYIGPNGAGKSTTIKMLTGILLPTKGEVSVFGMQPYENREKNAMQIGVVFGHRTQLLWDLPIIDTIDLYKHMYRIPEAVFRRNCDMVVELLGLSDLLRRSSRELSLGQRMRANIALCCLHDPKILYLDEPTIGLDIMAKDTIRSFLNQLNQEKKTTILLTTHDMTDIEETCRRIIFIDDGQIFYDGPIERFKDMHQRDRLIQVTFRDGSARLQDPRLALTDEQEGKCIYRIVDDSLSTQQALSLLIDQCEVEELSVKKPSVEDVVKQLMQKAN